MMRLSDYAGIKMYVGMSDITEASVWMIIGMNELCFGRIVKTDSVTTSVYESQFHVATKIQQLRCNDETRSNVQSS